MWHMDKDRAELDRLRAAVLAALTSLRADSDAPSLTRSVVAEHNLSELAELVGMEWTLRRTVAASPTTSTST